MNLGPEYLERLAAETGFRSETLEKVIRLGELAADIHVALAATLPRPLHEYGEDRLDRVTDRAIQEQLVPMLHRDETPTAPELKRQAWSVLAPLVTLDDDEREYIDRVHAGELSPELLFPDDEELAGVRSEDMGYRLYRRHR